MLYLNFLKYKCNYHLLWYSLFWNVTHRGYLWVMFGSLAVRRRLLCTVVLDESQDAPCGIYGGLSGRGTSFSPGTLVFSADYHSIIPFGCVIGFYYPCDFALPFLN